MKKFTVHRPDRRRPRLAALLLMRMAPRREDSLGGAETARVVRRDLERGVTATGVIKPRVGAEVRVGSRAREWSAGSSCGSATRWPEGSSWPSSRTGELDARRSQATAARRLGAGRSLLCGGRSAAQAGAGGGAAHCQERARSHRAGLRGRRGAAPPGAGQSRPRRHPARLREAHRAHRRRGRLDLHRGGGDGGLELRFAHVRHPPRPRPPGGPCLRGRDRHRPHRAGQKASLHRRHLPRPGVRGGGGRHLSAG